MNLHRKPRCDMPMRSPHRSRPTNRDRLDEDAPSSICKDKTKPNHHKIDPAQCDHPKGNSRRDASRADDIVDTERDKTR